VPTSPILRLFLLTPAFLVGCASGMMDYEDPGPIQPPMEDPMEDPGEYDGEACDGLDDDMDGLVDEGCTCDPGETQPCFAGARAHAGVGACAMGTQRCDSDFEFGAWDVCIGEGAPSVERCDGVDNDCDGETDEGCECLADEERECYSGSPETLGIGRCRAGVSWCVETGDGSHWSEACDGEVLPGEEVCDGAEDEDCDGRIDEGCDCALGETRSCYGGEVGTAGTGVCTSGVQRCEGSAGASTWGECEGAVTPMEEVCDGGLDEDCDGLVDCADPDCGALCCDPYGETLAVVPAEGEILFVVDRSGSMDWEAVGGGTRWEQLRDAMDGVLPMLPEMDLGLLTFPEWQGGTSERLSCEMSDSPDIAFRRDAAASISARLALVDPVAGDTPTPGAFATASSYLAGVPAADTRFVVLVTDGLPEPNCGATVPATVSAISGLRADGVETFVLGIVGPDASGDASGIPALQDALNEFAVAGGRPRPGATQYYEAVDGPELSRALDAILASATECQFDLAVAPPRPGDVTVRLDGDAVPAAGYTLAGRHLEFHGTYCDRIQAGAVTAISVEDDC